MKNKISILLLFVACACHESPAPNCNLQFTPSAAADFNIFVKPIGKQFNGVTTMEVWGAVKQPDKFPIPGVFAFFGDDSQNFGEYITNLYATGYYNNYGEYLDSVDDHGKYIYLKVRLKNECGFSDYQIVCYHIGIGIE